MSKTVTNITTLKINYLSQADYDAEVAGGTIEPNELYLTPSSHGGGASAFVAESGVTSYADVRDAYDDDAILICTIDDSGNTMVLQFVYFDVANEIFYFAMPMSDGWLWTQLSNADGWDSGQWYFASTDVATQLADGLMSALDKQKLDGLSKRNIWYGTCSTSASTSPKVVTTASGDFSLTAGNMLVVLFSHANSLSGATLKVDGLTDKAAYPMDGTSDISNRWGSNELAMFAYDGSKFIMLEQGMASTTAYGITKLNNTVTSSSTSEAATANAVKTAYDHGGVTSVNGSTGAVSLSIHNVPSGGTSGQVLSKASGTDYDLAWATPSSGSVTDVEVDGTSVVTGGVAEIDLTGKSDVGHTHTKTDITDFPSIPTITDTYSGTSSDGMSGKAVKQAIDALDGTVSGTAGAGKTLTAFSQTDGKVSATFGNISITKSQVSDFPTIPTVNNATLTIQKNSSNVATFTANASSNVTANITVPTDTGDLTNGAGFITGYTETDPVFSASAASGILSTDIDNWNGKQDELVSGTNIRTINGTSVLGNGDITVSASGTPIPTASTVAEFDSSAHINSADMSSADITSFVNGLDGSRAGLIDIFYPVGSYYETSDSTFDPNIAWNGTWVLEIGGQVHISAGTGYSISGALTNTSDGGATSHQHAVGSSITNTNQVAGTCVVSLTNNTGSASSMQPYIIVNRWHRTA